ncbi:MAG: penicillin-insensitive murein endopeptidase [Bradymonadales bacterium]|nr:penicillin-insensitive murein endopeptidase [Bradymonadales bacterium]
MLTISGWGTPSSASIARNLPSTDTVESGSGQTADREEIRLATRRGRIRHTVRRGETLSELANEYGVTVDEIRRWNDLESDLIRVGQELIIRTSSSRSNEQNQNSSGRNSQRRTGTSYIVERGDTLSRIAQRYGVTVSDLTAWNPGINPDRIREGQELSIRVPSGRHRSSSIGRPNRGRLSLGVQLEPGPGYRVRNPSRSWGTQDTIRLLTEVFDRMHRRYPDAPNVTVGDLSYQRGGRMRPHASHQSGRDVDIGYYLVNRSDQGGFARATPETLDVRLTWYLLKSFIDTGAVQYIFVDHELQAALYDYLRQRGATQQQLAEWFQYPRRNGGGGIIRHARGHDDHIHIRFRCSPMDNRCTN